jgi:hypothetical protein
MLAGGGTAKGFGPTRASRARDAVALAIAHFHPAGYVWDPEAAELWVGTAVRLSR